MTNARDPQAEEALAEIRASVLEAVASRSPLSLKGGGTKQFLCPEPAGKVLSLAGYAGVVDYAPSELVLVARAGTLLVEVETLLAANGQQLAFEPPRTGPASTLGGVVGAGLSGPARPYAASVRDHLLGVMLMDCEGRPLRFGGKVMKNVAGYDISRLVAGAWGSLGPVLEIALRVVPRPGSERCFAWEVPLDAARQWMQAAGGRASPLSGLAYADGALSVRFSGSTAAVEEASEHLPAAARPTDTAFWAALRDWRLPFFSRPGPLWRLVVPPASPPLALEGEWLWDWGGAQRWLNSAAPDAGIQAAAKACGGHARRVDAQFARRESTLPLVQRQLEARLRQGFDPHQLFNPELAQTEA